MPRKQPERDLANACTQILELDGWTCYLREPVYNAEQKRMGGQIGEADRLYMRFQFDPRIRVAPVSQVIAERSKAEVMFIEWKSRRGRLEPEQAAWHSEQRRRGALTLIVRTDFGASVKEFLEWYSSSGLLRRQDLAGLLGKV